MNLDDGDLGAFLVRVLVECDQPGFIRLYEVDEVRHTLPLAVELPVFELVGRDEDEWACHGVSVQLGGTRS